LPTILTAFKIDYTPYLNTQGVLPLLLNMAGLGVTPPHSHTILSTMVVFCNIAINLTLFLYLFLTARELWRQRVLLSSPRPSP
jgi:hypothetical protein